MRTNIVKNRGRVAIWLPYLFSIRDFLFTSAWNEFVAHPEIDFYFLTTNAFVMKTIAERDVRHIQAYQLPEMNAECNWKQKVDKKYLYPSLLCRFVAVNNLSITNIRKEKSLIDRLEYQMYSGFDKGQMVAWPFEKSKLVYDFLFNFRHRLFASTDSIRSTILKDISPDLFMIARIHHPETVRWLSALKRLNINAVGYVASWDQTTTQGPTPKGLSKIVVASHYMKTEMLRYHGFSKERLCVVGKPQMDIFTEKERLSAKKEFFTILGIRDNTKKLILFAGNVGVLGVHEPFVAKWIVDAISDGNIENSIFVLRPHPQDKEWRGRFSSILQSKHVVAIASHHFTETNPTRTGYEDQIFFTTLLYHSNLVIQTRGSTALDAFAFEKPVISIAFDGDRNKYYQDSIAREYEYEHYQPIVMQNSTWLVSSIAELKDAIRGYLADPQIHASGREKIRKSHIDPLDGESGRRMVDFIIDSAGVHSNNIVKRRVYHGSASKINSDDKVSFDIRSYLSLPPVPRRDRIFDKPMNNLKELWLKICPYPPASGSPVLLIKKGRSFLLKGQTQNAMICADRALSVEPTKLDALRLKLDTLWKVSDFKGVLSVLDKILELNPDDSSSLKYKVMLLVKFNEPENALDTIKALFKCSKPDASLHELYYKIGLQLLKRGDTNIGKEIFSEIIKAKVAEKGILSWASFKYGEVCLDQEMRDLANSHFKLALSYNQNHIKAKIYLVAPDEPLHVSIGKAENSCNELIHIPLDDPFETDMWEYYFDRRKPEYIQMNINGSISSNDMDSLSDLLVKHLSETGRAVLKMKNEGNVLDIPLRRAFNGFYQ